MQLLKEIIKMKIFKSQSLRNGIIKLTKKIFNILKINTIILMNNNTFFTITVPEFNNMIFTKAPHINARRMKY